METPLVSICIPVYNGQKYLEQCINSAINQTFRNIEIIIVDDLSTDKSFEIAQSYASKDSRIRLVRNEKNLGLVGNWNYCLELATCSWIKFLFQDDYLDINCIEQMVSNSNGSDKIIASKRSFLLNENADGKEINYYKNEVRTFEKLGIKSNAPVYISSKQISSMAVDNICLNFIGEPTAVMFKKDVINDVGKFNSDLTQICDLEYFLRIASKYGIRYIPTVLTFFRIHDESTTGVNHQEKLYTLSHLDPIILANQMLFDQSFQPLRNNLSFNQKIKLKLYFYVRLYESWVNACANNSATERFKIVAAKYSKIDENKRGAFFIKIFLAFVKLRRKTRD